ncbi:hypothetical protein ACRFA2_22110 [Bacteroides hominis]
MPRVKKPAKVKEPVRLRMKELVNGNKSLYWTFTATANGRMSI